MFWLFFLCFILGGIGGAILYNLYLKQTFDDFISELQENYDGKIKIVVRKDKDNKKHNKKDKN
ncbi:MAG: hypothetical protein N2692_00475 [Patescibacteria group bacterium]|nr:hypothetical protein [Patescibacteria group bacterium]